MLTINSIVYGLQYLFLVSSPLLFIQDLFKYAADPDLSYFRSPTLRIPWTRRLPLSYSPTEGCLSRMFRRPWKVHNTWIIFVTLAMYVIELSHYFIGGNLNGVYFERCLKWFWVQNSWWDDVLFFSNNTQQPALTKFGKWNALCANRISRIIFQCFQAHYRACQPPWTVVLERITSNIFKHLLGHKN